MIPKYTFLLPAYKATFLDKMLKSIQGQTYPNFKVIISDDCSPEDLKSICEPYLMDTRFVFRRNETNMGKVSLVSHWNLLVDLCDTEYCIMASDDDIYDIHFLEEIDKLVEKYSNVNLFRTRAAVIDEDDNLLEKDVLFPEYDSQFELFGSMFRGGCYIHCLANFVFKTGSLKSNGGFIDFPAAWYSDDCTALREAVNGIVNTNQLLFFFRNSSINISSFSNTSSKSIYPKLLACMHFIDWVDNWQALKSTADQESLRNRYFLNAINYACNYMFAYMKFLNYKDFRQTFNYLDERSLFVSKLRKYILILKWLVKRFF